jgi:site-specific recombinase XerD
MTAVAPTLQAFFTQRLTHQRQASPHTIAAYRDTLRLLIVFASRRAGKPAASLDIADLTAPVIAAFLDHLQHQRGNSTRTRNARLAAIHSLFAFLALHHPEHAADTARVLAIPTKRADQTIVTFLTPSETDALLAAPDTSTRTGRRDHALLLLAVQTGLRAGELTGLTRGDVYLGVGAHVSCHGKGRKDRITPLTTATITVLRAWLREHAGSPADPLFPTNRGTRMSSDALTTTNCPPRHNRDQALPLTTRQDGHPTRATAHRRDAAPPRRRRHHRDRAVARPRVRHHHADLPAGRPDPQTASPGQDHPTGQHPRPLPTTRPAPRLPRSTLITNTVMPTSPTQTPPPTSTATPMSA